MRQTVEVKFKNGSKIEVPTGTTFSQISKMVVATTDVPVTLVKVDNSLKELGSWVTRDTEAVELVDLTNKDGLRVYQRSVTFLMTTAAKKLFPNNHILVNHHIMGGYFCEWDDSTLCTDDNVKALKDEMLRIVAAQLPITKESMPVQKALEMFEDCGMNDKKELFKYRRTSTINIYTLDGIKNYFYGYMVPSTEDLKLFDLMPYGHGFILLFPDESCPSKVATFKPQPKLSSIFKESEQWARIMDVDIVASLNDAIVTGKMDEIIRISEALHEKKIAKIADQIAERPSVGLVLIAGPSSSGKTTFAQRLCTQLRVNGLKPHAVSIDDYFVDREFTPRDEEGNYDFEALEAIDVDLFNDHVKHLLAGEKVEIPSFNFVKGKREYRGNTVQLGENDILVVEGIHGLNEKLSYSISKENKFKIYVSCLTQLNVDYHNRIPTTDTRLIRRMVRDYQYRGMGAERTMELWPSVRRGENKNIFPFQEDADAMFNSMLIYELGMLKLKAEPLLFSIDRSSPYYSEAKRLLKFLEYFLPIYTENIPCNSIIREFLGGSCFH